MTLKDLALLIRQEIGKETEYEVVLHGVHQMQRGRKPSMPFQGIKNPRKAFKKALEEIGFPCDTISLRVLFDKEYCRRHDIPFFMEEFCPANYGRDVRFHIQRMKGLLTQKQISAL